MRASGGLVCQGIIDGTNGTDGYNTVVVPLYRRSASVLTDNNRPSGPLTYTFSTGRLTGASTYFNGWSQTIPTASANTKLYVIMAVARSQSDTDEIAATDWSTPVEYVADGMSSAPVFIYKRAASQPTDKPADGAVYTFATGALTGTLNGWSTNIPATDNNHYPCWVRQAMAVSRGTTDTINADEWSNPATKLVEDGVSISSADIVFVLSDSGSTAPADSVSWKTTFAELDITSANASKYIWQATKVTLSNNTTKYTGKQCLGKVSEFASVTEQYALGTASAATGSWQDNTPPTAEKGKYLWTRTKLVYSGGGTTYVPSESGQCIGYFGNDGAAGYSIALTLIRNNLYTDANWNTYATIGHNENFVKRTGDSDFAACRAGDYFVVTGTSSDSGRNHTAIYKCTSVQSDKIYGDCVSHTKDGEDGEDGDDAVTYQIVLSEGWAKVDASNNITARLRGHAYKIVGSTRTPMAGATIMMGYVLNNTSSQYPNIEVTTNNNGYFSEDDWFNSDTYGSSGYVQGSQTIFAAIKVGTGIMCVEYVTMTFAGAKGDTGRMYYIAGEFPKKAPYSRTAKLCPVVYYATAWWYLDAASATANDIPSNSSQKWKILQNYGVVLTDAIFVKNFAQFGAAIITGDWLISVHGTINGVYYGGSVEEPGEYNNRAAYTYFDPAYPMGFESFQIPVKTDEVDKGYSNEWTRITNNFSLTAGTYIIKITCYVNSSDTMHLRLFDDNDSSDAYYLGSTTSDEVVTLVYTKTITAGSGKFNLRAGMNANGEIGYIESIEIESTDARFIPNYAVDLRTGRTYQNDANIRGKIVTIGPSSKVEISEGVIKLYGAYNFPNIVLGVDANGCAVLNFYDKNGMFTYGLGPVESERTQSQAESFTLQYYNIDAGSYDATEIPNNAIVTVYRYMFKSQVPPSSTFLKKYLAKIMANAYFGGNYCASGEEARYFNGKFIKASYHSPFQTGDVYGGGIVVTCNNPQSGIISSKETMLNGRSIEELELRGYNVMQDSDYNRTKEGDVYYYNTKDAYSPVQAFWLDTSAGGGKGYGSGFTWFGYINLIVDPTDWNEDKLADPIYWFNLQYIDSKGVGSYKTLYINKSKLQAILQNAGYSL